MSDVPVLGDRERIARVLFEQLAGTTAAYADLGERGQKRWLRSADAVLADLPTPSQYLAGLADDDALVKRVRRRFQSSDGRLHVGAIRDVILALATAVEEQP